MVLTFLLLGYSDSKEIFFFPFIRIFIFLNHLLYIWIFGEILLVFSDP